jgi:sugar lactone lactonase YvrE
LLIGDSGNHKIRKLNFKQVSTYAGPERSMLLDASGLPQGALLDGKSSSALFHSPGGLAAGSDGTLYVADTQNNAIRIIAPSGQVTTLAGNGRIGSEDGTGTGASFYHPGGIAVTKTGIVYVADTLNHVIRKIDGNGVTTTLNSAPVRVVEAFPGLAARAGDYKDGKLSEAWFNEPTGLALDDQNNLYVSDTGNQRIRYINFTTGQVTTVAGAGKASGGSAIYDKNALYAAGGYKDGKASDALFDAPKGIALDSSGGLVVADSLNHVIRYIHHGAVTTLAGLATESGMRDGIESTALFNRPDGVAIAADDTIYIADTGNNRIRSISLYRLPSGLTKDNSIKVVVGQDQIKFDAKPETNRSRIMVPVRQIAEKLGYKVSYADGGSTIRLTKADETIELYLNMKKIKRIDGNGLATVKATDVTAYNKNNRTYVPLRFFAEETGSDVQWIKKEQIAILRNK